MTALSHDIEDDVLVVTMDKPGDVVNTLSPTLVGEFGPAMTLMILAAWAYTRWWRRSRVTFVILSALALWTAYIAVVVPVAAAIDAIARRSWRRLLVSALAGGTIFPWLCYAVSVRLRRHGAKNSRRCTVPNR